MPDVPPTTRAEYPRRLIAALIALALERDVIEFDCPEGIDTGSVFLLRLDSVEEDPEASISISAVTAVRESHRAVWERRMRIEIKANGIETMNCQ
jgi:hypothetical protein